MRISLEDVFGKFEVLRICFGKEDMDIGRKKEKRKTIIGDWIHGWGEFLEAYAMDKKC